MWNDERDPITSSAGDLVRCDELRVAGTTNGHDGGPSAEVLFGKAFLEYWAARLESQRRATTPDPVTPEQLGKRLEHLTFFASTFATMSGSEEDDDFQLSSAQKKRALDLLKKTQQAIQAYDKFRTNIGEKADAVLLPESEATQLSLTAMIRAVEKNPARPRARNHYELLVKDVRLLLKDLTGGGGRVVDRETGLDSGYLYTFSLALLEAMAPSIDPTVAASRIRTAVRAPS